MVLFSLMTSCYVSADDSPPSPPIDLQKSISCDPCALNDCYCVISGCTNGRFIVYNKADCSAPYALFDIPFLNEEISWKPDINGSYYAQFLCDDETISSCTSFTISESQTTTTSATTTTVSGQSTTTTTSNTTTTLNTIATTTIPVGYSLCKREGFVCTEISYCCPGLTCVNNICKLGSTSVSSTIRTTSRTTTSIIRTTTTLSKQSCPYDCCESEDMYYDRGCPKNYVCESNTCNEVKSYDIYYSIILAIAIGLSIPIIVIALLFWKSKSEWNRQYEKHSK